MLKMTGGGSSADNVRFCLCVCTNDRLLASKRLQPCVPRCLYVFTFTTLSTYLEQCFCGSCSSPLRTHRKRGVASQIQQRCKYLGEQFLGRLLTVKVQVPVHGHYLLAS